MITIIPLLKKISPVKLENEYGIVIERKAISRNISLLKEAGVDIESRRAGSYLECRDFEDSELHMLIDGVLSSKHITRKALQGHHRTGFAACLINIFAQMSSTFIRSMIGTKRTIRLCFIILN